MGTSGPLIDVDELTRTDPGTLLLVDCRFDLANPGQGRQSYLHGHLPGAVYASLDEDLSDLRKQKKGLGRHPLPEAGDFATALGRWGWHEGLTVVAYDAGSGAMAAARLWWLMRWMDAPVRVLDGGVDAWQTAGQAWESGIVERAATRPEVHFDAGRVIFTGPLREGLENGDILLMDARAAMRYRGERESVDPVAGHVPGACNRPFTSNLDGNLRWRSPEALRGEFLQLIDRRDPASVVHMCGSGVTACHNLLAMEHAGLHGSRLYAPSWSGWISDPENRVATGDAA